MTDEVLSSWADLLADYCLGVRPGNEVLIRAELEARPLVEACYRAVVLRNARPVVRLEVPGLTPFFLRHAADDVLANPSAVEIAEAKAVDQMILIASESDPRALAEVDPGRQAAWQRAREPVNQAGAHAGYVLTQYPTAAYASVAGILPDEYEKFVSRAMFLNQPDPAVAWRVLGQRQQELVRFMSQVGVLRIEAEGTDLTLSVAGRHWINSDGRRNMPSGEIFSAPIEESVTGRLRCGFPVCRGGRQIAGIELEIESGRVVAARAEQEEAYLLAMLDVDPGARSFGEIGIGLNPGIDRFTGRILYDEKIDGTVHLALGDTYPETGGTNKSALHWDLIIDTRTQGRVTADGRVVMENGRWRVG